MYLSDPCESVFCGPNEHCMLINYEAKCLCAPGYTGTHSGCVDIDECAGNPCASGAICKNEPGSFSCQCPGGATGDPFRTGCSKSEVPFSCSASKPCPNGEQCVADEFLGSNVCICVQGYVRDSNTGKCRDVNECLELRDHPACGLNAVCKNLPGSYECQCPPGFNGNPFTDCVECNTPECKCQPPYKLVNGNCILSGCSKGEACPDGAECITISGGVSYCACPKGSKTQSDGSCLDVNECKENRQVCGYGAECVNLPGGFECHCPTGYGGDPYNGLCSPAQKRCISDNECSANEKCVQPGECVCPPPFFMDSQDGNKCKNPCERYPCGINAKCTPSDPPKCMCETGYKGDPFHGCVDVDECADRPCAYGAHCLNEKGGYKCVCPKGMTGDPYKSGCILLEGSTKAECITNNDCANTLACIEGACVSPCGTLLCGPNAYCEPDKHAAWCRCGVGFTESANGECVSMCDGFSCGQGANCIVTANGPTCKCVEGYIGNPFPGGKCTTDVCSATNPCQHPSVCINGRCKERCESIICGVGATCDKSTNKCVCDSFFVGNPDLLCMPPFVAPSCQPNCGRNAHCEYGLINQCVCAPGTSGNPYEGCQIQEKQSCENTICGAEAQCRQGFNSIDCVCPPGYAGNPYVSCHDIDECSGNACGQNAVCINTLGGYDCRCRDGFVGNPFVLCSASTGGVCDNPHNCQCSANVVCPSGYSCERGKCKNVCQDVRCGPRAGCDAGKCICPPGYVGNPRDLAAGCKLRGQCSNDAECSRTEICFQLGKGMRKCLDACSKVQCGPNALCVAENHISACICAAGYSGNPSDLATGCQPEERVFKKGECELDGDCSGTSICALDANGLKICVDPCQQVACSLHEVCQLDKLGHPTCHCRGDFIWNPVSSACEKPAVPDCTTDADCQQIAACRPDALGVLKCTPICSEYTCPLNAACVAIAHKGQCQCLPDYTGNPNDRDGCRPAVKNLCSSDAQCHETETCQQHKETGTFACRPACELIKCGPYAVCVTNNHVAQCQCPPGSYVGNPNDISVGCKSVPCVYNIDCPPTQLCNRLTHSCYDICDEDACGTNAVCIAENHKAVCQCPPGYRGNPIADVECVATDSCSPNPCHPSGLCSTGPSGHVCHCPPNQIGDPYATGCRPEGNCLNGDRDCPPNAICQQGRCVNPCDGNVCGPNSLCKIINRKVTCSCPVKFIPVPSGPQDGCLKIVASCTTDLDCGDEVCFNGQCRAVCRNNEDCSAGERCLEKMCMIPCITHTQCSKDQACMNGMCLLGCRSNKNCPSNQACINNKCLDPCQRDGVCGPNAKCSCVQHTTTCKCPAGFEGNPVPEQGCVRVPSPCEATNQCPTGHMCIGNQCNLPCTNNNICAVGERCSNNICVKVCYGDSNCLPGEVCLKGICQAGCTSESDCKPNQICIATKCRCSSGFIATPQGCHDINECEDQPCHPSAQCINIPGSYRCQCPEGTVGDPFIEPGCLLPNQCSNDAKCADNLVCRNGKCTDPCPEVTCGPTAICNAFDHSPVCACPAGHLGDPYDINVGCFKVECLTNSECPRDKYCHTESNKCMNPCDQVDCGRGTCKAQNHQGLCSCFAGYVLKDGKCTDVDECTGNPCHPTAM